MVKKIQQAKPQAKAKQKQKRRRLATKQSAPHPYLRCISGGVQAVNHGVGFPDGSTRPTVVVDFRQAYTITPSSGVIKFALISSPYGTLAVNQGTLTANVPRLTVDTAYNIGSWPSKSLTFTGGTWNVIPFGEISAAAPTGMSYAPFGPYSVTAYRSLVNVADCYFTGASMANGGTVRVYRATVSSGSPVTATGRDGANASVVNTTDLDNGIGAAANFATHPARASFTVRSVNSKPDFRDIWDRTTSTEVAPYGRNAADTSGTNDLCWPGYDDSMPVNVVNYSGLDSTASVTIEIRCCLEMAVNPGALPGIAKPSPMADTSIWQKVANYARSVPTTTVVQTAAKAVAGYASGGLAGALLSLA